MGKKRDRVLRFAVTGALLVGAPALACGGSETHSNEPAPEHTTNEPAHVNEPMAEDTSGGDMGTEEEIDGTVNEVEPEDEPIHTNERAPE